MHGATDVKFAHGIADQRKREHQHDIVHAVVEPMPHTHRIMIAAEKIEYGIGSAQEHSDREDGQPSSSRFVKSIETNIRTRCPAAGEQQGPGCIPCIMKAAIIMAVVLLPGIPKRAGWSWSRR
jgi:hypothetical protein